MNVCSKTDMNITCCVISTVILFLNVLAISDPTTSKVIKLKYEYGQQSHYQVKKIVIMKAKKRNLTRIRIKACCGVSKCSTGKNEQPANSTSKSLPAEEAASSTKKIYGNEPTTVQPEITSAESGQTDAILDTTSPLSSQNVATTIIEDATAAATAPQQGGTIKVTSNGASSSPAIIINGPPSTGAPTTIAGIIPTNAATSSVPLVTVGAATTALQATTTALQATKTALQATTTALQAATTSLQAATTSLQAATNNLQAATTTAAGLSSAVGNLIITSTTLSPTPAGVTFATITSTSAATTAETAAGTTTTSITTTTTPVVTTTTTLLTTTAADLPLCPNYSCTPAAGSSLGSDGSVSASAVTNGTLRFSGDRQYMFSYSEKSWSDAASDCCSLRMKLLTLETTAEYAALAKIIDFNYGLRGEYFTSGSDNKVENSFVWCTSNATITSPIWGVGEPSDTSGTENCVTVNISPTNATLGDRACTTPMKYICEAPVTPRTNSYYTCTADARFLGADGQVNVAAPNPDGDFIKICGRQYFVGQSTKNWADSGKECCRRKMMLAVLETVAEQQCVYNFFTSTSKYSGIEMWNAGNDQAKEGSYTWFYPDGSVLPITIGTYLKWDNNQPDNFFGSEDCIQFINRMVLNDKGCSSSLRYLCEQV